MKTDMYLYGKEKADFLPTHLLGPAIELKSAMVKRLMEHHEELTAMRPLDVKQRQADVLEAIEFWEAL